MKRFFSIIVAFVMMITLANAQNYVYPGHLGMPYVAVDGGVVTAFDGTFTDMVKNVAPTAGVELGTYVTPVWGASVQGIGTYNANGWQNFLGQSTVLANGKMNLSNFFAGYKGYPRRVEFVLVAGAGWSHNFVKSAEDVEPIAPANWMTYNTGAEINVNLGNARAWQINVRPNVLWNHPQGGFNFDINNADARLTLGVTYKFGNRRLKSHNFVKNNYAVTQENFDALQAKYNALVARGPEVKEVTVEKIVEKPVVETRTVPTYVGEKYITFPIGSAVLSAESKARLNQLVKEGFPDNSLVYVIGSADSKTGTETFNYDLAAKRAKVVKEALVNLGVDANKIVTDTTLDATDDVRTSRAAVITIVVE